MTQKELRRWYYLPPEQKTEREQQKILGFIKEISDPFIADIFKFRYIDCCSWSKVAELVGGKNTADGVRMVARRYVARISSASKERISD